MSLYAIWVLVPEKPGIRFHGAGVTGGSEPLDVDTGNESGSSA